MSKKSTTTKSSTKGSTGTVKSSIPPTTGVTTPERPKGTLKGKK